MSFLIFLVILDVLILVHEFGHYIFAKLSGVRVKEFALGIGPKIFSRKIDGTVFSIRAIPFGGFNDIKGQEEKEKGEGNFVDASFFKKVLIILGGIIFNLLLGVFLFYVLLFTHNFKMQMPVPVEPTFAKLETVKKQGVLVVQVLENPALKNISVPFVVTKINDITVNTPEEFANVVSSLSSKKQIEDSKLNNSKTEQKVPEQAPNTGAKSLDSNNVPTVTLEISGLNGNNKKIIKDVPLIDGKLQVYIVDNADYYLDYGCCLKSKILSGILATWDMTEINLKLFYNIIKESIKSKDVKPLEYSVSGPVGVYKVVDSGVKDNLGKTYFVKLLALLSLSLAIFNLLPFPGLDGWHLFIIILGAISAGKLYNAKIYRYISAFGLILLILLSIIITIKDIKLFF